MTIIWYVYNLNVSHKIPFQITKFACYLQSIYGEKLNVKHGKVHDYLGMGLDYSKEGTVYMTMIKYGGKILNVFPVEIKVTSAMSATDHLFQIREKGRGRERIN